MVGEEDEPPLVRAIVEEELRPPIAEEAHPLAVAENSPARVPRR
jgi:hypothetical protein